VDALARLASSQTPTANPAIDAETTKTKGLTERPASRPGPTPGIAEFLQSTYLLIN
jgi:hypothetical protein